MTKEKDLTFQGEIQRLKKTINIQAKDYIELNQENKKLKKENTLLKEQLLKKSETEQSFQSLLEENQQLKTTFVSKSVLERLDQADKYEVTLQEIKNMIEKHLEAKEICYGYQIVDKIDEVLKC